MVHLLYNIRNQVRVHGFTKTSSKEENRKDEQKIIGLEVKNKLLEGQCIVMLSLNVRNVLNPRYSYVHIWGNGT